MTALVFVAHARGDQLAGYTATLPDLPDVSVMAGDLPALVAAAREAVHARLERYTAEGLDWPKPTAAEALTPPPGAIALLVDVSVDDPPVRVNLSIGERLLKRIDDAAEARGMSRSGYVAQACRAALGDAGAKGQTDFEGVARKLQDEWAVLGRKLSDSFAPDSSFNKRMGELDQKLSEAIRKAADNLSAAMSKRTAADARSTGHASPPPPETRAEPPPADVSGHA